MIYLSFALIALISIIPYNSGDPFLLKWFIVISVGIIVYGYRLAIKYHWLPALLFAFVGINAAYNFEFPNNIYNQFGNIQRSIVNGLSAKAFVALFITILIADFTPKKKNFLNLFLLLQVCNVAFTLYQWLSGLRGPKLGGFYDNISLNGGMIALSLPIIFSLHKIKKPVTLLYVTAALIANFLTGSSIAIGLVVVAILSYSLSSRKAMFRALLISVLLFSVGHFIDKDNFFNDSHRFNIYKIQFDFFNEDKQCLPECYDMPNRVFGYGQGCYPVWSIIAQLKHSLLIKRGERGELVVFLHNDWLQMLLENGYIGIFLSLLLYIMLSYMSFGNKLTFSLLQTYAAFMVFHYPAHYPVHAIFGVWLIMYIILQHKENIDTINKWGRSHK